MKIDNIRKAFLWTACEKVSGENCKIKDGVQAKTLWGLGILNLTKFVAALRLRRLWFRWGEDPKPWMNHGNPNIPDDHELFAAAMIVTIGNGEKTLF